jgi:RNA polymerase sigma-70 factor (ECF subfamily)
MNRLGFHDYYKRKGFERRSDLENLHTSKAIRQTGNCDPMRFIDEYSNSVYKFCRSITYSKEDAEDLCQETFLRALEQPMKIDASGGPQRFLFSTAMYLWKSWKRKYARRERLAPTELLHETVKSETDIEGSYLKQEENRIVRNLVEALPDKFKIPTILQYTFEMSITDIAATLHLPSGTVKSRLFKARKIIEKGLVSNEYQS